MLFGTPLINLNAETLLCKSYKKMSEAQIGNLALFTEMYNRFSNIAITRYEWSGLPQSVNERFLNQTLYLFGNAVFFEDPNLGYLALPCTIGNGFNIYYNPISVHAYSFNYEKNLSEGDFVYIRNNPTATPTAISVYEYCQRMSDVIRTIDVLCKKMKQPFIVMCDEKQRQTYLNLFKNVSDNEVIVLGVKDYDIKKDMIDIKPAEITQDLSKLWDTYHSYENLLYTALGINSANTSKRERLITDEVNSNNMVVEMSIEQNIKELKTACEEINRKYKLNISVKARGIEDYVGEQGESSNTYDNPVGGADNG